MTITINHPFVSAKGDGSDATVVRPSNWNASHNLNMATNRVVGRLSAGNGLAEELPVTAFMMGLLNTADFATLAIALGLPTTGDAKLTFKQVADAGWVLVNDGAIGDALSGAGTRANADTVNLFTFFYNNFTDAIAPLLLSTGVLTSRAVQGTASIAFGNHCRILLPRQLGRSLIVAGAGGSLTNRTLGDFGGEETHLLALTEVPAHTHTQQGTFAGSVSGTGSGSFSGSGTGSGSGSISGSGSGSYSGSTSSNASPDHLHGINGQNTRTGAADRGLGHTHSMTGCANLSSTGGGQFATGYPQAQNTGGEASPDHLHGLPATTDAADRSLAHSHSCSGGVTVSSVGGSCSVTTVNVNVSGGVTVSSLSGSTSITISGQTGGAGGGLAHNNMQPWAAWNVMIKL